MNNIAPLGFVDANVLANAIIVENEFREMRKKQLRRKEPPERTEKKREEFLKSYEVGRPAHELFQVLHRPPTPEVYVVTSNLAKLEVTGVIAAEFKCRQLFKTHVPFRYWNRSQSKIRLSRNDLKEIQVSTYQFFHKMVHVIVPMDEYSVELAETLVTEFGCETRDAILVSTGVANHCPLFITEDLRLQRKLRKFKRMKVVKTQYAVDYLKSKVQTTTITGTVP